MAAAIAAAAPAEGKLWRLPRPTYTSLIPRWIEAPVDIPSVDVPLVDILLVAILKGP